MFNVCNDLVCASPCNSGSPGLIVKLWRRHSSLCKATTRDLTSAHDPDRSRSLNTGRHATYSGNRGSQPPFCKPEQSTRLRNSSESRLFSRTLLMSTARFGRGGLQLEMERLVKLRKHSSDSKECSSNTHFSRHSSRVACQHGHFVRRSIGRRAT